MLFVQSIDVLNTVEPSVFDHFDFWVSEQFQLFEIDLDGIHVGYVASKPAIVERKNEVPVCEKATFAHGK